MSRYNERNKTVAKFEYKGESYVIHERKHKLSDGTWYVSRFLCDSDGNWQGWANNVKQGREILNGTRGKHELYNWLGKFC
jgi:hypothetical protein